MTVGATDAGAASSEATRRVLILLTEEISGDELLGELSGQLEGRAVEVILLAPAVEKTPFHHALGDVDGAVREARERLERSLAELRRSGIRALGEIGDSDPVLATEDCLRRCPAEEVWILAHAEDQARWFEDGLFERAQEQLYPAVRMVTVRREGEGRDDLHPVGIERAVPGHGSPSGADPSHPAENVPPLSRGDVVGILVGIVGTIVAIVLAAAGPGPSSPAGAASILIAMAVALINMAHVVGLVLIESVAYRGGWQRFFRNLSGVGTPLAVIANLAILLFG